MIYVLKTDGVIMDAASVQVNQDYELFSTGELNLPLIERPSIIDYDFNNMGESDGVFTPPLKISDSIGQCDSYLQSIVFLNYQAIIETLIQNYPPYEDLGWPTKRTQARQWAKLTEGEKVTAIATIGNDDCEYRMIFREAVPNSDPIESDILSIDALCDAIIYNDNNFQNVYGITTGKKKLLLLDIATLDTATQFDTYNCNL